jgi:hypothetical protein
LFGDGPGTERPDRKAEKVKTGRARLAAFAVPELDMTMVTMVKQSAMDLP